MPAFDPTGDYLLHPESGTWLADTLDFVQSPTAQQQLSAPQTASGDFWTELGAASPFYRPYRVENGILQIPVMGALLHRFPYSFGSWATGYDYIHEAVKRGLSDADVLGMALVTNSPGGQVSGCFDCADFVHEAAQEKPVVAIVSEHALSAAYALASAANHITVARTGGVGSIGVVATHLDMSKALEDRGMKVTFVYAGKHKVDGNSYEPLPDDVKARIQERVENTHSLFVSTVARNRGMDEEAVRATEANVFMSHEAVENGLADEVGSFSDAIAAFAVSLSSEDEVYPMDPENEAVGQAAHDKAVADAKAAGIEEGKAQGLAEGANAERQRIADVKATDEAKARPAATEAALKLGLDVEATKAFLADLPEENAAEPAPEPAPEPSADPDSAGAPADPFAAAMHATGNPNLGAEDGSDDSTASRVDDVMSTVRGLGLPGFKTEKEA